MGQLISRFKHSQVPLKTLSWDHYRHVPYFSINFPVNKLLRTVPRITVEASRAASSRPVCQFVTYSTSLSLKTRPV